MGAGSQAWGLNWRTRKTTTHLVKEVRDEVGLPEERASLHPGCGREAGMAVVAGQSPCFRMALDALAGQQGGQLIRERQLKMKQEAKFRWGPGFKSQEGAEGFLKWYTGAGLGLLR